MPSPLFLAIDQGTSASRAVIYDLTGRVLKAASLPVATSTPRPGWVEQDAGEILSTQMTAVRRALSAVPKKRAIAAIGISNQRSTLLLWRRRDGAPVGPALSWQDLRTAAFCNPLGGKASAVQRRTGLRLSPHYAASKLAWLIQSDRSVRTGLIKGDLLCGTVNSFLIWHLTRGSVHLTDHTNAARMLLLHLGALRWDPYLLSLFEIPEAILPEVRPTFGDFGTARVGGRDVPIRCSMGDQQAALLGQGCVRPGEACINYGTGGFFLVHTGGRIQRRPGLLTSIASSDPDGAAYLLEGTVNAVGSLLNWTKRLVGFPAETPLDSICKEAGKKKEPEQNPIRLIPALAGLGAPHWLDRIPFMITGLNPNTRGEDLVRASLEAIAFLMRDIYRAMGRGKSARLREILVSGGVSKSDSLLQFQSDLLQLPLKRSPEAEASARGAALGAAIGSGLLSLNEVRPLTGGTVFSPKLTRRKADRLYRDWVEILKLAKRFEA